MTRGERTALGVLLAAWGVVFLVAGVAYLLGGPDAANKGVGGCGLLGIAVGVYMFMRPGR